MWSWNQNRRLQAGSEAEARIRRLSIRLKSAPDRRFQVRSAYLLLGVVLRSVKSLPLQRGTGQIRNLEIY